MSMLSISARDIVTARRATTRLSDLGLELLDLLDRRQITECRIGREIPRHILQVPRAFGYARGFHPLVEYWFEIVGGNAAWLLARVV